ncbi:general odorant-binding protein 56d-like [Anopheles bellator]|uniref:general odorant-binding protein 56d-like n=1 Tax=Anopheles bellator TaxID=139047 RepID=UPI002648A8C2|nr:general odorant-binding protein 56d-like [Anopheles bellator]
MKFCAAAIVLIGAIANAADNVLPDLKDVGEIANGEVYALQCLLESGIKLESLTAGGLAASDLKDLGKVKCMVRCFFEKTGFMDKSGKLQQDAIVEQLSRFTARGQVEELVRKCNFQEPDACDTAYRVTECYFQSKAGLF